jgi:hypothetical protein
MGYSDRMKSGQVLAVGALVGVVVAMFGLGEEGLAFKIGALIGGALGGTTLAWLMTKAARWTAR